MVSERRRFPRVCADLPLEVRRGDGEIFHATVCNISRGGLEARCDRWCADRLLPPGHQAVPGRPVDVRLAFTVAAGGAAAQRIEASAQIVESRRLAQNEFRVGMTFTAFHDDGEQALERFLGMT